MQIILLEKIERLGGIGSVVTVKDGYARNFLLPYKKALRVTKENLAYFEEQKAKLLAKNEAEKTAALDAAGKIEGLRIVIIRQAGDTGHLYGSVNAMSVAEALKDTSGVKLAGAQIRIDKPIKEIGIYEVKVFPHPEVMRTVKLIVARSEDDADNLEKIAAITKEKAELAAKKAAGATAAEATSETPAGEADASPAQTANETEAEAGAPEKKEKKKAAAKAKPAKKEAPAAKK